VSLCVFPSLQAVLVGGADRCFLSAGVLFAASPEPIGTRLEVTGARGAIIVLRNAGAGIAAGSSYRRGWGVAARSSYRRGWGVAARSSYRRGWGVAARSNADRLTSAVLEVGAPGLAARVGTAITTEAVGAADVVVPGTRALSMLLNGGPGGGETSNGEKGEDDRMHSG
jgi:hypothetical protein